MLDICKESKTADYDINVKGMRLVRKGKCDPDRCRSTCCRLYMISKNRGMDNYIEGFFDKKNKFGDHYLVRDCKHLKDNRCKVWGTSEFPEVCKQFPNPDDNLYKHVFDECTFKFELRPDFRYNEVDIILDSNE